VEDREGHHVFLIYESVAGNKTEIRTRVSHQSGGGDIGDNLLGMMARQVKLGRRDFEQLIDCPLSRETYEAKLARPDRSRVIRAFSNCNHPTATKACRHHRPSPPRPSATPPPIGGRFMTTKPDRSKCSTSRLATIAAIISPASWTRLRPL
jgi:hypothetical protein